jgi:hypothetical protein
MFGSSVELKDNLIYPPNQNAVTLSEMGSGSGETFYIREQIKA